ncbi:MAG: hypothetical protein M3R43_00410 [Acidobacteriota bacterium]|nr:hypothetical protein [Acidobacteriota bacterium]
MPDKNHMRHADVTVDPNAEAKLERGRLPIVTPAGERAGMLPGIAGICMFLLLVTMLNAFGAVHGAFGAAAARYSVLAICTLLLAGIFGLLRLRRWGWALVIGGCLVMSLGDIAFFMHTHLGFFIVRGLLEMVFFLYLSRTEVRERLR